MTSLPTREGAIDVGSSRRDVLLGDGDLRDARSINEVLDVVDALVHDDPARAETLAAQCDDAAVDRRLHAVIARARYVRGRLAAERGELDRALTLIHQARSMWSTAGDAVQALRTDLGRMQVLDDLGRHHDAIAVGRTMLVDLERVPATSGTEELRRWLQAAALENIGVAHGFLGDHRSALHAYTEAEAGYRALGMEAETARPCANRGVELLELGRAREAIELLRSADEVFARFDDRLWSAKCAGFIALAHVQLGEYVEALRTLGPARETLEALGASAEAVRIQLATANVYLAIGLADEALREACGAAAKAASADMRHDVAAAELIVALAQLDGADVRAASLTVTRAVDAFESIGDRQQLARAKLIQAEIAAAAGDRVAALRLATDASADLEAGEWRIPLTWAHLRRFDFAQDPGSAAAFLARATDLCAQVDVPQLRHACDLRHARLLRRTNSNEAAEVHLRRAIAEIERMGERLPELTLRLAFRDDAVAAHEELIDLLVDRGGQNDIAEALRIGAACKGQTLADWGAGSIARHRAPHPSTPDAVADAHWRSELDVAYGGLFSAGPGEAGAARDSAAAIEHQIMAARISRLTSDAAPPRPSTSTTTSTLTSTPTSTSVRAAVPTATLEYQVSGSDVIGFLTHSGHTTVQRLHGVMPLIDAELDRLAAQWMRLQIGQGLIERHESLLIATCQQTLAGLYDLMMAPFVERLGRQRGGQLVVVPHRRLHQVPFHALFDGTEYLLERWCVTVAPSLTASTRDADIRGRGALVLAVPDPHTPEVVAEASALRDVLPDVELLVGPAATFEALSRSLPGPGIVHIACHGLFRQANPLFSSLRLGDRWMNAVEVLDLDLDGALVTLSACESGRGSRGTEPVGLSWAFLAAGASGVIVSEWVVNDATTAALMSDLYGYLTSGVTPPEALRRAQLAAATRHPHPFHWAPFVFVGALPAADRSSACRTTHG